jgi:hypothetical protein
MFWIDYLHIILDYFLGLRRGTHEVGVNYDESLSGNSFDLVASCCDYPCQSSADEVFCHFMLMSICRSACVSIVDGGEYLGRRRRGRGGPM